MLLHIRNMKSVLQGEMTASGLDGFKKANSQSMAISLDK